MNAVRPLHNNRFIRRILLALPRKLYCVPWSITHLRERSYQFVSLRLASCSPFQVHLLYFRTTLHRLYFSPLSPSLPLIFHPVSYKRPKDHIRLFAPTWFFLLTTHLCAGYIYIHTQTTHYTHTSLHNCIPKLINSSYSFLPFLLERL